MFACLVGQRHTNYTKEERSLHFDVHTNVHSFFVFIFFWLSFLFFCFDKTDSVNQQVSGQSMSKPQENGRKMAKPLSLNVSPELKEHADPWSFSLLELNIFDRSGSPSPTFLYDDEQDDLPTCPPDSEFESVSRAESFNSMHSDGSCYSFTGSSESNSTGNSSISSISRGYSDQSALTVYPNGLKHFTQMLQNLGSDSEVPPEPNFSPPRLHSPEQSREHSREQSRSVSPIFEPARALSPAFPNARMTHQQQLSHMSQMSQMAQMSMSQMSQIPTSPPLQGPPSYQSIPSFPPDNQRSSRCFSSLPFEAGSHPLERLQQQPQHQQQYRQNQISRFENRDSRDNPAFPSNLRRLPSEEALNNRHNSPAQWSSHPHPNTPSHQHHQSHQSHQHHQNHQSHQSHQRDQWDQRDQNGQNNTNHETYLQQQQPQQMSVCNPYRALLSSRPCGVK